MFESTFRSFETAYFRKHFSPGPPVGFVSLKELFVLSKRPSVGLLCLKELSALFLFLKELFVFWQERLTVPVFSKTHAFYP